MRQRSQGKLPRRGGFQVVSQRTSRSSLGWAGGEEGQITLGETGSRGVRPEGTCGECQLGGQRGIGRMAARDRK